MRKSIRIGKWIIALYAYKMPASTNTYFTLNEKKQRETK